MTGVELIAPDFDGKANKADLVISRAIKESDSAPMHVVILKSYRDVQHSDDFTQKLECMMQAKDCVVSHALWETELFDEDVVYLVLDFASDPVLHGVSDSRFVHVKNLLTRSTNAFWAVLPGCEPQLQQYEAGLLEGIGRTARSENESLKLVTLDASSNVGTDLQTLAKVTTDVMLRTFGTRSDGDICEDVEFVFKDNMIIIPRLTFDAETNLLINPKAPRASAAQCLFRKEGRPQRLHVESPGLLASILFIEDLRLKEPLGANEIEVHAMAYGINFKDVFLALGQMPADTPMAGECAGVVTAVGSNLRTVYSPGDRVCALGATPYASQPRVSGLCAVSIPDDMAFTVAASVPVVFVTAYYSIVNVARLQKGQSILIHSAAGGVGQAALMIAQYIGADIFATVGSLAKRCEIEKRYSIPGTHIFSSRSSNFRKAIMRLTRGKGVDVALNSTAGQTLLDTLDCISTFGTFVEIGKRDIYRNSRIPLQPFDKNLTFSSVDLALVAQRTPTLVNDLLRKIFDLFKGGNLRPVNPVTTLPISSLVKAFRIVQAGDHVGKLVLESSEGSMVKAAPPEPDAVKLDHRGTYVIAGGLGALGLKTCDFMARHGAANIVILSRSTPDDRTRQSLNRLMALGTDVKHFECDITDSKQIETVASHCRMTLPPVRGVIQAAMSLQVSIACIAHA